LNLHDTRETNRRNCENHRPKSTRGGRRKEPLITDFLNEVQRRKTRKSGEEQNQSQRKKKDQNQNAGKGGRTKEQEQTSKDEDKKRRNQTSTQKVECISSSQSPQAKPHKICPRARTSKSNPITPPSKPAHSY
jgi:hypothetical protein